MTHDAPPPPRIVHAFAAEALRVVAGANLGDPVGGVEECEPGDVYRLRKGAHPRQLALGMADGSGAPQTIAEGGEVGQPGETLEARALLTFLRPAGDRVEVLILHHPASGAVLALPLSPLSPGADHTLIAAGPAPAGLPIAETACMAFAAGTLIALPEGAPVPVERLRPGDRVLTRDHGAQVLRWIGKATLRAEGAFAPVVITAGTMGNTGDLALSPHHRVLFHQRGGARPGTLSDLLVEARHLVDGDHIRRREGGWVDYHGLVFDRHEIVYAEGIATESLRICAPVLTRLPPPMADELKARFPGLSQAAIAATEAGPEHLPGAALFPAIRRDP